MAATMATWQWEDETDTSYPATSIADDWGLATAGITAEMTLATGFHAPPAAQQVTTKIPPGHSSSSLWFTYEPQVKMG